MNSTWTQTRVRVVGVEELMVEKDGVVYRDDDWYAGSALAAFTDQQKFADIVQKDPDSYNDWVTFRVKQNDGMWVVEHDGEQVGANQNLDNAITHACSLPYVDLNPWHPD